MNTHEANSYDNMHNHSAQWTYVCLEGGGSDLLFLEKSGAHRYLGERSYSYKLYATH